MKEEAILKIIEDAFDTCSRHDGTNTYYNFEEEDYKELKQKLSQAIQETN